MRIARRVVVLHKCVLVTRSVQSDIDPLPKRSQKPRPKKQTVGKPKLSKIFEVKEPEAKPKTKPKAKCKCKQKPKQKQKQKR
jgi:hypothetical protein